MVRLSAKISRARFLSSIFSYAFERNLSSLTLTASRSASTRLGGSVFDGRAASLSAATRRSASSKWPRAASRSFFW